MAGMRGEGSGATDRGERGGLGWAPPHEEANRVGGPVKRVVDEPLTKQKQNRNRIRTKQKRRFEA